MSGRRIDDHSFWGGNRSKGSVFPEGNKVKEYNSAEGAGELNKYEDTTEAIKAQQVTSEKKIKAHERKEQYRN